MDAFNHTYKVFCDIVGKHDNQGRRQAQQGYIQSMMDSKILVVAQRDAWEDHYRLWEALASGAMVLTDPMLTLPMKDGIHLRIYQNLTHLVQLVDYYLQKDDERLQIAQAGYRQALSRHRSWHRMEEIILGRPYTTCDDNDDATTLLEETVTNAALLAKLVQRQFTDLLSKKLKLILFQNK